ncbi:MAG: DUF5777 family beta-barrel protein [Balneolaceae bacterium]
MKHPYNISRPMHILSIGLIILLVSTLFQPETAYTQLQRERAVQVEEVTDIFWSTKGIGTASVRTPSAGNLNSSVMHAFGLTSSGIEQFYGLDFGANTRFGLEYGITGRWSAGISRMTFDKVVEMDSKYRILRQMSDDSTPIDLAVKFSTGIVTRPDNRLDFQDRLNYFTSLMVARKFSESFSLQLAPMFAHFNRVEDNRKSQLLGLGIVGHVRLSDRFALVAEYLPVLSDRNPGTTDTFALGLDIETGGHVFQIFFSSSQWHNESFIMARNQHDFWTGDFRFGFNINRVFWLTGREQ